ncbi:MAG: BLUF domain-containing protein [Opitutales bacterium]
MEEELIALVYVSSASRMLRREELVEMLSKARVNNHRAGITGMLLYHDGNFMQALEGPATAVDALERRIARDPRHHGVIRIYRKSIPERTFQDWSMGFAQVDASLREVEGLHDLRSESFLGSAFATEPGAAVRLLRHFALQADAGSRVGSVV